MKGQEEKQDTEQEKKPKKEISCETNSTKYFRNSIVIPAFKLTNWDGMFLTILTKLEEQYPKTFSESNSEKDNKFITDIEVNLKQPLIKILNTPRLMKHFARIFQSRLETLGNRINLEDILCLSAIETSNTPMYNFITEHKEYFVNENTYINEYDYLGLEPSEKEKVDFKYRFEEITSAMERKLCSFVFSRIGDMFEGSKSLYSDRNGDEKTLFREKRLAHNRYFNDYFYYEQVSGAIFEKAEEAIRNICTKENAEYFDISKVILEYYVKMNDNDRHIFIRNILSPLIEDELSIKQAQKLLYGTGFAAKSFNMQETGVMLSSKKQASYLIWNCLKRITDENEKVELLENIIQPGISDEFIAIIIFQLIAKENDPMGIGLMDNNISFIANKFLKYCSTQYFKNNDAQNIFDEEVCDGPLQMLYRWYDAAKYEKRLEEFNYFIEKSFKYVTFIRELINNCTRRGHIEERINIKGLEKLINPEKFVVLLENINLAELIDKDAYIKAVIERIESQVVINLMDNLVAEQLFTKEQMQKNITINDYKYSDMAVVNNNKYLIETIFSKDLGKIEEKINKTQQPIRNKRNHKLILILLETMKFQIQNLPKIKNIDSVRVLYYSIESSKFSGIKSVYEWIHHYLNKEELEILVTAFQSSDYSISILSTNMGKSVRAGQVDFEFQNNKKKTISYLDALQSLMDQGYVQHDAGITHRLTSKGIKRAEIELEKFQDNINDYGFENQ